ncbi:GNAT domain-containing protein [Penicillium angulare]|uniref:GNAT domain-containing protein n=1 Tax=Penicillium angulare TaxID=116970 RepID=UPI002540DB88|nr:GNAT domain-containing protein [Penicillium angulare]KAJ5280491.1 GNAT domain-containing protein [Penicillium angulare]
MDISLPDLLPSHQKTQPIYTSRLTLRPFQWTDLPNFYKLRITPEVMQWTSQGGIDTSIEQTREWMQKFIEDTDMTPGEIPRRNFNFVVSLRTDNVEKSANESENNDSNAFIGVCGLYGLDSLPVSPIPSLGYMYIPESWGKGYATEASLGFQAEWQRLITLGHQVHSIPVGSRQDMYSLRAVTHVKNLASAQILRKCGWTVYEEVEEDGMLLLRWIVDTSATATP